MSAYLVGRVLWADLPAHLKLTAVIIADAANDEGYAYPGQKRIAAQLGQSERQVRNNVGDLVKLGILTVVHRGKSGGGRSSNGYQFDLDSLPHPQYGENRKSVSGLVGQSGNPLPVQTGNPVQANRKSSVGKPETAISGEPSENHQIEPSESMSKPAERVSNCPHLEIIRIYHEVLPERPRIIESLWKGSESETNLRARWQQDQRHRKLIFWEQFFRIVRTNDWWMGRDKWKGADLHWLVKRKNFRSVVEHGVNSNRQGEAHECARAH